MRWVLSFSLLAALAASANSQEVVQDRKVPPPVLVEPSSADLRFLEPTRSSSGYLVGTRDFPNFIGFLSNPIQSIDPRAHTQIWPMFGSGWVSGNSPRLPSGDIQVGGPGIDLAISDRFSLGLNQGGYVVARFTNDRERLLAKLGLPVGERDRSGLREGWLNFGLYFQYTLIADVPNQFLLTAGMRVETPSGATQIFQGSGPTYLAPYLTAGKEFGLWHVLAITGFEFPAGRGDGASNTFYANFHIDRQIGWLYPLVEFNCAYHTTNVDINLQTRHGVIDMGTFSASGNIATIAVGANAVLVPGRVELGAVYIRPISAQNHFDFDAMLVKMVWRY